MAVIPVTDRTSVEADETCGMKRWWFLHEEGRGIVLAAEPPPLRDGIAIHASLAALLESQELVLPEPPLDPDQDLWESWARQVGWLVAFHEWVWPQWFAPFYDIVDVEKELVIEREGLWVAFTPDIVLRSRATNRLVVVDFKSVGMQGKEWHESWPFAVQLHLNQRGVAEEYQEPVSHAIVVGLTKGQPRDGKLRHPYVWAYSDGENWSTDWRKNWDLRPLWEYGSGGAEGIREWVLRLGPDVGLSQFPVSVPIVEDRAMVEEWLEERAEREAEVSDFLTRRLTMQPQEIAPVFKLVFPKRRIHCKKAMGGACPYLHACWNADIGNDPLGSGLYVRRIPHHDVEVD
jgi:hypothetical protein